MRSISDQSIDELGGSWSVLHRQKRDHVLLDGLLNELVASAGTPQAAVMNRICRLVFPHAFAEESVLWPELRKVLPDGEQLTLEVEREHQEVNELVTTLEDPELGPAERRATIDRLVEVLRQDVRDEEDQLLPRLQEAVSVRRLRQLGVAWELVRRTAPTRPHPVVSRRPPGNVLAALPLSAIDRTRDVLDAGAQRLPDGTASKQMRHASGALARGAGRIERIGPMRQGEDASTRRG